MKRLSRIQADGLKNLRAVDLKLDPFIALGGPNGSGKSALLQAVKLAVLGYDPAIGKTLQATRQLARNGNDIDVALTFSDGFGIRRSIGASTSLEVAPPQSEVTLAQKQTRIERETGTFLPTFDLQAFLDLSAEKRREYLFSLLPRESADLTEESFRSWLGYSEAEPPVKKAIDLLWQKHVLADSSPIDGLASAIRFANEKYLEAERERQGQHKVVDRMDDVARESNVQGTEHDPERLVQLQAEIQVVNEDLGKLHARQQEYERFQRRQRERDHQRQVLEIKIKDAVDRANETRSRLAEYSDPDPAALLELEQRIEEARRQIESAREAHESACSLAIIIGARRAPLLDRLEELVDKDSCPLCGSTTDIVPIVEGIRTDVRMLTDKLDELDATRKVAEASLLAARQLVQSLEAERTRLQEAESLVGTLRARQDTLTREEQQLRDELHRLVDQEPEAVTAPEEGAEDELSKRASYLRQRIADEQTAARAAGKADAERERADAERRELEKITRRADALRGLHGGLQKLRAHVIEHMVGPVESVAAELLSTIDSDKSFRFVFEREGRDEFDLGFTQDGVFRSYDAASTGEDAFLAVVLVAALIAAVSPPWAALLIDNAESVDRGRREALMMALTTLQDRIGNVILSGCCEFPAVDGWTLIHVPNETRRLVAI